MNRWIDRSIDVTIARKAFNLAVSIVLIGEVPITRLSYRSILNITLICGRALPELWRSIIATTMIGFNIFTLRTDLVTGIMYAYYLCPELITNMRSLYIENSGRFTLLFKIGIDYLREEFSKRYRPSNLGIVGAERRLKISHDGRSESCALPSVLGSYDVRFLTNRIVDEYERIDGPLPLREVDLSTPLCWTLRGRTTYIPVRRIDYAHLNSIIIGCDDVAYRFNIKDDALIDIGRYIDRYRHIPVEEELLDIPDDE